MGDITTHMSEEAHNATILKEVGETFREVIASTAAALPNLARQLEEDQLDDGFHDLNSLKGSKIGEVYLDFHSTEE